MRALKHTSLPLENYLEWRSSQTKDPKLYEENAKQDKIRIRVLQRG